MEIFTQNQFIQTWLIENKYVQAVLIILAFLVIGKIITFIAGRFLKKIAKKTKTKLDDLIIERIKPPFSYVMLFVGLKFALRPLGFEQAWFGHLVDSIVIIAVMHIVATLVDILLEVWATEFAAKTESQLDDTLMPLVRKFIKAIVWIIAGIWILKEWGVDIGPFLASLGIAGFVIGFALQDSLKSIFAGLSLVLDKAYKVGDRIKVDGEIGEVIDIGIRSTKIKTFSNELITIPNSKLADSNIQNFVKPDLSARAVVDFGVEYGSDVEKVKEVILGVINEMEDVILDDPEPAVVFYEMGDSALKFQAKFWVPDYTTVYNKQLEAIEKIYNALNKAGIGIPFPTTTVYLKKEE